MRLQYEELRRLLREWHNPNNEPGQYDSNGLMQLMLAILDNLREHEAWVDLPEIRGAMTDEQAAFFLKLATFVRADHSPSQATNTGNAGWPTFGQLLQYRRDLGFVMESTKPGVLLLSHAASDSEFLFRDRDQSTPAREVELLDVRIQLTYRGFVTEQEFARFWNQRIRITS